MVGCPPAVMVQTVVRSDNVRLRSLQDAFGHAPQVTDVGRAEVVEDQSPDLAGVTGSGGDDLVPALLGQHGERGAAVLRIWGPAHPAALLQPQDGRATLAVLTEQGW